MTEFSSEWLLLREAADHKDRNTQLQSQVAHWAQEKFSGRTMRLMDLGCGTGSNLRALAPLMPQQQHWTLVDYDAKLLLTARQRLMAWADSFTERGDALLIQKQGKSLEVIFAQKNLMTELSQLMETPPDLMTAAAFFDLVSVAWLGQFCQLLRCPLYAVLTYNGQEVWTPSSAHDALFLDAFHQHQRSDKGFGVAAGPAATDALVDALEKQGFLCEKGASPWRLTLEDHALMQALASGAAGAVKETAQLTPTQLEVWTQTRKMATHCQIGHWDVFALPKPERA